MYKCMKTQNGSKQKMMGALVLLTVLLSAEVSSAVAVLDLNSKNTKKTYNVEVNKEDNSYEVVITEMKDGQSELIYKSYGLNVTRLDGHDEYKDGRVKLVYRKDGTATLNLNNGQNIKAELSE